MWGVLEAEIEGQEGETAPPAPVDPAVQAAVEARLADLFRHTDRNHPAVAQVFSHCVAREICRAAGGGADVG